MTKIPGLADLAAYSADIGADPLLIQGAGGNTSIKGDDVMWIKASGTQLKDALKQDLFVGVDGEGIAKAVRERSALADEPQTFLRHGELRPSIETCLHAVMPHRVVIHVHCVNTIAQAIRLDAEALFSRTLARLNWAFVPYAKPGAGLASGVIAASATPQDVYVLGNHGLLVGAEDVASAQALLADVVRWVTIAQALDVTPVDGPAKIDTRLGSFERAPDGHPMHAVALSDDHCQIVATSAFFPDQVLFCGPDIVVADDVASVDSALAEGERRYGKRPPVMLVKQQAAYIRADASQTEREMIQCLGDVMVRVPGNSAISYLTSEDCAALLNWDAETYRHRLNV